MRILQITKKFPWPAKDGEVIGIVNLTSGLSSLGHDVTVLSLNTKKHHFDLKTLPEEIRAKASFEAVDIDTSIKPLAAFFNLFSKKSYNIERFYSKAFELKIAQILSETAFDLIIMEGIYLMRYIDVIRKHTTAKVMLRPQNVEYVIWERLAYNEKNVLKKAYLNILARRMRHFERVHINKADMLVPLSNIDLDIFIKQGCHIPGKAFPIGYIGDDEPINIAEEKNTLAFIGGMDWLPNCEGIEWFIKEVWPIIIAKRPQTELYIAGRNTPEAYKKLNIKGIYFVGEVDSAKLFMLQHSVFIVPLLSGSGMRVKIIEAMALRRAIISTSIGAESLHYTHNENIIIADNAMLFAESALLLLENNAERMRLGVNAQKLVKTYYDNRVICQSIIDYAKPFQS